MSRIAVLGPGAVGATLAVILSNAGHEVTCISHENAIKEIDQGIELESATHGKLRAHPKTATLLNNLPDYLIIACKSYDLKSALRSVQELKPESLVIPLLNGHEHMKILREQFGHEQICAAAISIEARRQSRTRIIQKSPFIRITLGADSTDAKKRVRDFISIIEKAKITGIEVQDSNTAIWKKLVRLNALSLTTALSGKTIGEIRTNSLLRELLRNLVAEGVSISRKVGVDNSIENVMNELDAMPETLTTSLANDLKTGHRSELDSIAGGVLRLGKTLGCDCPILEKTIAQLISLNASVE